MDITSVLAAFIAGVFMFLAPCTLPMVPSLLSYLSAGERKKVFINTVYFVLGFSLIFILLGGLVSFLGGKVAFVRSFLTVLGGFFIILLGFYLMGFFHLPFFEKNLKIINLNKSKPGKPLSSFIFGASFAAGWTPCVGPILASILLLAGTTSTVYFGILLLAIFSLGLAIPFLITALFSQKIGKLFNNLRFNKIIQKAGGVFLIFIGLLLLSNNFYLFIRWGFNFFNFLNYDKILNFL